MQLTFFSTGNILRINKILLAVILSALLLFVQTESLSAQTISCPADIVKNNDPGSCAARVFFPDVTSSDPNLSVFFSRPSGALFPVGTTRVAMELWDQNGTVVSSCNFNVTILDKEAPILSNCTGNVAVNNAEDACGATIFFTPPGVFERCTSQQKTFNYTGAPVTFVVPAGVTSIRADVKGAAGGRTYYNQSTFSNGGWGGEVGGSISVTPGQVLTIIVGGVGDNGSASGAGSGGYNGGGNGSASVDIDGSVEFAGGGGGGASDIRVGGSSLSDRIMVAGGGGAAGFNSPGGSGGGLIGANGQGGTSPATGGTQTEGGTGASYNGDFFAGNGSFGIGGDGAAETPAGGGGGGYYGGGGGSFGSGAGGSNFAFSNVVSVTQDPGAQEGNGSVTLTYNQPATLVQTTGLPSGSFFPVGETINTFTATDAAGNTSVCTFKVTVSDVQPPVLIVPSNQTFSTLASTYNIPALVATDNCGVASVTYTVTGATTRTGTGTNASGSFNPGTSYISFTVTDKKGNVQTGSTTVNILGPSTVTVNVADVWAVAPWGNANTIYLGFGPATLTLNATVTSGAAPFAYSWQKTGSNTILATSSSLAVAAEGIYTVTVTDKYGAKMSFSKEIKVEDLRCGNNDDKIAICHMSTGVSDKARTVCVSREAVNKFLGNGNYFGQCRESEIKSTLSETQAVLMQPELLVTQSNKLSVYPNPASGHITVHLNNYKPSKAEVIILSLDGTVVQRKTIAVNEAKQSVVFLTSKLAAGMYIVKVITEESIQTARVLVKH